MLFAYLAVDRKYIITFEFMKERVFYILFLFLVVIFTISEQDTNSNTRNDISTFQSINAAKEIKCIVPQFKIALKKNLPTTINPQLLSQNILGEYYNSKVLSSLSSIKLNYLKMLESKPLKLTPYKPKLYHSSKNQDEHHLS